ncbi:MBL fold metallo-hydrolase [Jeotgalibacillus salarius]|uniref:MBL fold metallo-hydrolase n=1 Tax=Jeotgalibacillus salarius TaxID=546023 RepID=A0A4Y8L9A8_9BACL|nr:MBL fold metallo-hydrolase [Jeotgalibacillus salarius]TFD99239.1 MBL fold metallo-hydrolase [Jeotgalibacillus salarius]
MQITTVGFWGGYPGKGEASTGYLIEEDSFKLLLDCGSGVLAQLQRYISPEELDAMLITHYHADHTADIGVLHHALLIQHFLQEKDFHVKAYGHTEDQSGFDSLQYKNLMSSEPYHPDQTLKAGPFSITFLKTIHPVPCYAVRIESESGTMVFTADSAYQDEFISFAENADLLIAESNFYKGMDAASAGHMTSTEAAHIADQAKVKTLMLSHLPHFGDLNQLLGEAKEVFNGETLLASSGLTITYQGGKSNVIYR